MRFILIFMFFFVSISAGKLKPVFNYKKYGAPKNELQKIQDTCAKYGISYQILNAIIKVESSGQSSVVGVSNDIGLCQITPIALKHYNFIYNDTIRLKQLFNPFINQIICIKLLAWSKQFTGDSIGKIILSHNRPKLAYELNEKHALQTKYVRKVLSNINAKQ